MSGVLVVGAGQAGCQVVTSLREDGYVGPLTLIGSETHLPYQRPPLSKGHLTGKSARESLFLRPDNWYVEHDIAVHLGVRVASIDLDATSVALSDGTVCPYDSLVLALGSRHREIGLPGRDLDGVLSLRTLDEADEVRERLTRARDVVVIGGGFIGMEVAATAASLGKTTTVLEIAPQLMGRVLSVDTAQYLVEAHRSRGLEVELGVSATQAIGLDGSVQAVDTSDGERLPADLVLLGVGAVPNVELAVAAGLTVDNGIVVDEYLQTSVPNVYAIGDCASAPTSFQPSGRVRLESVQNATAQARAVAATLSGTPTANAAVPWFWSDQADLKLQIAGLTSGHDEVVLTGSPDEDRFSAWCFLNGALAGVESINRPADHMAARRILATPSASGLTPQHVRAEDFDAKRAAAGLASR